MRDTVVVWGLGQLGGVFARGLLRLGKTVTPVLRDTDVAHCAAQWPEPALVLIAVGERELPEVLARVPEPWRGRVGLLQNELLPSVWQRSLPSAPTVCVVWFEKRATSEVRVVLPSVCYGAGAELLSEALQALSIPTRIVTEEPELHFELALKNLYILTINCAGLAATLAPSGVDGGDVETLWQTQPLTREIAREICQLQSALLGESLSETRLLAGLEQAILADPQHAARGRFAEERLRRSLAHGDRLGLALPTLRALAHSLS